MAEKDACHECGTPLPENAPEGLCPKCLMRVAMGESRGGPTLNNAAKIDGPGTAIGRYELLELIGEGGMGLVYLAEQKEPVRRKVALKIIKPGMDSKQVIARFEAERQALALLDHPNIAHVFDAGTTDTGRPYFVMEFVRGMSITRYCDERRLNVEQRLRLFRQVCEGVHHAHQKGIIHRDIKPSNILISMHGDRAVPKIIDFGIAKAAASTLTEKTMFTCQGQLLGTPEYMSPEQVDLATQDIDTRSDIYSLGVVLYELLAGVLPFERESLLKIGFAELQRTLRESEPASPSIRLANLGQQAKAIADSRMTQVVPLARRLHRELEWIPLKAMRKDRCRRYKSASDMADDIQNYLNGNPLLAGPETAMYRVQKFVHKHAGSVATAALVSVAVIIGLVVSIMMGCRAEQARQQEAAARKQVEQALVRAENAEKATKEKAEELRRTLYVNSIQLAEAKYSEANIRRVHELLESCPDDLRAWEWYRLSHIMDQSVMTFHGHSDSVNTMAISPDGKRIVSGSDDKTIKIWDSASGDELMTLRGHDDWISSVAFSPDGKRIISGSGDNTVKVWDSATGAELMTLRGHIDDVYGIAISPDGKHIVSGSIDRTIRVWNATNGDELMTIRGHQRQIGPVSFSPDGRRIISGSMDWTVVEQTIKVWDAATGTELMTLFGHDYYWINSIDISPDGKRIISGGSDGTIKVWDSATGGEIMTIRGHKLAVAEVAFSPDGKRIVSGSNDGTIKVWDVSTGTELMTLLGHRKEVCSVTFSPDGTHIISSSKDTTIKVWDTAIRTEAVTLAAQQGAMFSIAFSPDGKRFVSGGSENTVKVWNVETGTELMTLRGHDDWVSGISFSPDGRRIASGSRDKTIKIWDAANGAELMTLRGDYSFGGPSFSPDSRRIVCSSNDNTVRVWNAATGEELMVLHGHRGRRAAFSPDGRQIVLGSGDGMIIVWDASTGAEVMTLRGHSERVWSVAFSPDGKLIVSGSSVDPTVRVWDAGGGAEVLTLPSDGPVLSVAFSPDGKRIISGSMAGTVKVWDSATGAELMTLRGHSDRIWSVAFSPDGKTIAAGTDDDAIRLWESTTPAGGYEPRRNAEAARKVVDELYEETGFYSEVIDKLKADKTLDESVRETALQIANSRSLEESRELAIEIWNVIRSPGGQIEAYRLALEKAEMANHLEPNRYGTLARVGVAQYRVGAYQDALTTLTESESIQPDHQHPSILAFKAVTAMALHQLGRDEEARAVLNRAHVLLENWQLAEYYFAQAYVIEAEKLCAGENTKLYSAWESIVEGRPKEAVQLIEELRSLKDAETTARIEGAVKLLGRAYYNDAETHVSGGEYAEAISDYEVAVRVDPDRVRAFNDLAWLRATCVVTEFRDGAKAIEKATKACELTNFKKARYVGTLAAAYAEAGDFDAAVKRQKEAIDLLTEEEEELRSDFEERLKLYQSGKPYRESL